MLWIAMLILLPFVGGILVFVVIARLARISALEREVRTLQERLTRLEARRDTTADVHAAPPRIAPGIVHPVEPPAPVPAPRPPVPLPVAAARGRGALDPGRLENRIGSVWFQNLGAGMVLVGTFFLILWGYTTGRFGPGVLVGAGVVTGLTIAWRGDRLARVLPRFGQALIGLGFGVVYVTLFLGHFTLRVLPPVMALALLVATAIAALLAGLRHRVQTIAALGVLGAFLPQILARTLPVPGFTLAAGGLLAWLAAVNVLVFALVARAGWSALDLASLLLTALTWEVSFGGAAHEWPVSIGLSVLFIGLGLAPVPRLTRHPGEVRTIDLCVIVAAPFTLLLCAWPSFAVANARLVGMHLTACAALYLGAALWVDARRSERDLWRPLTGAATLFLTIAIQRFSGPDNTPIAWAVEAVLLVSLGVAPGAGWLRACGYAVALLSCAWLLDVTVRSPGDARLVEGASVRNLATALVLLAGAWRLYARRDQLEAIERLAPPLWLAGASIALMVWSYEEAAIAGWVFAGPRSSPDLEAPPPLIRRDQLTAALTTLAWFLQSALTVLAGLRTPAVSARRIGYAVGALTLVMGVVTLTVPDGWGRDVRPFVHAPAAALLVVVIGAIAVAVRLARAPDSDRALEPWTAHAWAAGATLLLIVWIVREADHVARLVSGVPGPNSRALTYAGAAAIARMVPLAHVLTSAGWLIEAVIALLVGWFARSRFVRWMGLVLAALTALKFVLADLASADPFWRFLTAIAVGLVLLVVSFAYQHRQRTAQSNA